MKNLAYTLVISAFVASVMSLESWEKHGSAYESKSASTKQNELWQQVTSNTKSNRWFSTIEFAGVFLESMKPTIDWVGDTFENGWMGPRNKYIHSVGNTATVKFVKSSNSEGYTGIFEGADYGIIRLSAAVQPD